MPNYQAHIELANRNLKTLEHLLTDKDAHAEWIATIAFYRAVHIVETIFAPHGTHSPDHGERHYKIKKDYQRIWHKFRLLWVLSSVARYLKNPEENTSKGKEFSSFKEYLHGRDIVDLAVKELLNGIEIIARDVYLGRPIAESLGIKAPPASPTI